MSRSDYMFLVEMEKTREERTMGRPQIWQMDGYRNEWNAYVSEWVDENSDWR